MLRDIKSCGHEASLLCSYLTNCAGFFHGYDFSYNTEIINSYSLPLFLISFWGIYFYQLIRNTKMACFLNYKRNTENKDTL